MRRGVSVEGGLTQDQIDSFHRDGLLVLRNLIQRDELETLREETLGLVELAGKRPRDPDFKYRVHELTGESVPFRIEYVVNKTSSAKALLGHPFVLRAVEQLEERSRASVQRKERPFEYNGELLASDDEQLTTWRYPHEQYWRR